MTSMRSEKPGPKNKLYLGEAVGEKVYAETAYGALVLTTENGMCITNRIVLEPEVYKVLVRYVAGLRELTTEAQEREGRRPPRHDKGSQE